VLVAVGVTGMVGVGDGVTHGEVRRQLPGGWPSPLPPSPSAPPLT
jgi:hypothetical protein